MKNEELKKLQEENAKLREIVKLQKEQLRLYALRVNKIRNAMLTGHRTLNNRKKTEYLNKLYELVEV